MTKSNGIGELAESSLHHALKLHYQREDDEVEQKLEGYVIDVQREHELVEIQTSSFSSIKKKYRKLLKTNKIRMVYPIAEKKWLIKQHRDGSIERRKSPKKGKIYDVFRELVSIPHFLINPDFILDIVMIHEEEHRVNDGKGSWRRKGWSIIDHKLVKIVRTVSLKDRTDFDQLLPQSLPEQFTTADISKTAKIPKYMSQKMAYTLKKMEVIHQVGKKGRYHLYERSLN